MEQDIRTPLPKDTTIRCQSGWDKCQKRATVRRQWRTRYMPGPAFWYGCDEHAASWACFPATVTAS